MPFRMPWWLVAAWLGAATLAPLAALAQLRPTQPEIAIGELPREARDTLLRIRQGGPFPFERDGVRFGNRERLLPARPRDYYREYTVKSPGAKTRGARRIVCGGPARRPDACYYTSDHYQSFARIRE
ncbi:MAG TPA: ribonuclease domain-containing protein [Casimicrobiaceae bacterium]|nr:ribonuclease domain-containing protein [Casimicrobiaceae bacterium]